MINVAFYSFVPEHDLINFILKNNKNFKLNLQNYELLIVLGGDGVFLDALNKFKDQEIKLLFIKTGNLGFFENDVDIKNIEINNNKFENYSLLKMTVDNETDFYSFNEFLLSTTDNPISQTLFVKNKFFYSYTGTGFLVSTMNGSSGINRSLNGPLLSSNNQFIFSEFIPVNSTNSTSLKQPIVFTTEDELRIRLNVDYIPKINLKIDGKSIDFISKNIKINLVKSKAKIYKLNQGQWINRIQKKILGNYETKK